MSGFYNPGGDQKDSELWWSQNNQFAGPRLAAPNRQVGFATGDFQEMEALRGAPRNVAPPPDNSEPKVRLAVTAAGIVNILSEHVISHPFIVFRRQCQVNRKSKSNHLTPFTLIPFAFRLQKKQGLGTIWKGFSSVLLTRGMVIATETVLSELLSLPKDFSTKRVSFDGICQHLVLKGLSVVLVTPFFCSSCIETVQSGIASDSPGILDFLKEGVYRSTFWTPGSKRVLPIWVLCCNTVVYELSFYMISSLFRSLVLFAIKQREDEKEAEGWCSQLNEFFASFWGRFVADMLLFPVQTILFRLYLQGTRTIIDNVDQTSAVIPVISDYDSPIDCYKSIVKEEGSSGLFKGFGALIMQFAVQYSILKLTKFCLIKVLPNL